MPSSTGIVALPVGTPGVAVHLADVHPRPGQRRQLAVAGRVRAHPADHVHARPEPARGGGLVGALAAGGDLGGRGR